MVEKWRVTVERYEDGEFPGEGNWIEEATLSAPRESLARFAPGVVAEALGVNTHAASAFAVASTDQAAASAPAPGGIEFATEPEGPKRRRRTKAEMEAARAAEQRQDAAEVAVTNAGPDAYAPEGETSAAAEVAAPAPAEPFNPFAPK